MSNELLRLENLSVDYRISAGYLSAVNNVSFAINKGEIFALVGESGCGKSTVAHTIMRLSIDHNEILSGKIMFEDRDLLSISEAEMEKVRGKQIGMVFQNPLDSLNPVYRSGTQVAEALMIDGMSRKDAMARTIELYREVHIPFPEQRVRAYPNELSGGMRQRVMIAMMLSRTPELLIADEPTTALDVTIEAQILQILKDLKTQYNTAILMITHNFGLVAEVADRIAVMYAGNIVEQGNVFDVFAAPSHPYTRLLMRALPRKTKHEGRLETIDGNVPRITEKKPGCRFANRCPLAKEICFTENPPVLTVSHDHTFSCHFAEEASKL